MGTGAGVTIGWTPLASTGEGLPSLDSGGGPLLAAQDLGAGSKQPWMAVTCATALGRHCSSTNKHFLSIETGTPAAASAPPPCPLLGNLPKSRLLPLTLKYFLCLIPSTAEHTEDKHHLSCEESTKLPLSPESLNQETGISSGWRAPEWKVK